MHFNCFFATIFLALVLASIVCMVCAVPISTDLDIQHQPKPASTVVERIGDVLQKPNSVLSFTFSTAAEIKARTGIKHTTIPSLMVEKMMKLLTNKLDLYKPIYSFILEMCAWVKDPQGHPSIAYGYFTLQVGQGKGPAECTSKPCNGMVRIQMAELKLDTEAPVRGYISMGNEPEKAGGENGQKEEEVELEIKRLPETKNVEAKDAVNYGQDMTIHPSSDRVKHSQVGFG
ncbi:hypothetical protein BT96DRAFT_946928 [Gymnopus androsaceus JB14]|uniref:Uncharacterized protein n=1 Tax=Gymnopus androsaceus JB14 TaxID=1447944 RepID=A0A6A4GW63_9AGAR|nr:hypothetical protein BT96DRAFT_946928 [Gymnopus androsaceus JB14]